MTVCSEIKTYTYENGEIQRVQCVRGTDFGDLRFLRPASSDRSFTGMYRVYRDFIVPKVPAIFGRLVLFRAPEDYALPEDLPEDGALGEVKDPSLRIAAVFRKHLRMKKDGPHFTNESVRAVYDDLSVRGLLKTVYGKRSPTVILPVGRETGYLSEEAEDAAMKVNASFFTMDVPDCGSPDDVLGTPVGLAVRDGVIEAPPLYGREALTVLKDGGVRIKRPDLRALTVKAPGKTYEHGGNAAYFARPDWKRTPKGGFDHVIVGRTVVAVKTGGKTAVPSAGFVLKTEEPSGLRAGDRVSYGGMENVLFAVQTGNSVVRDGIPESGFSSPFYDIKKFWRTPYPPSLYPLDYEKARAPRIALGADREGRPMILWAEGPSKLGYQKGADSCGASLLEFSRIAADLGMMNGINLDGGGSAQILIRNKRSLRISDRDPADGSDLERAVPLGIMIP